jgi:hypothetical protein
MNFDTLTEANISLYLMKTYDNPHCRDIQEFWDDVSRIKYLKRLFRRYNDKGILKERLILNHLITFYNVFLPEHATRILFYKLESDLWGPLSTFLTFLNFLPEKVSGVSQETINTSNILLDMKILDTLQKL